MEPIAAEPTNLSQARAKPMFRRGCYSNHRRRHCDCSEKYINLQDINGAGKKWKQTCKACPGNVAWGAIFTFLKIAYKETLRDYESFTCSCEDSDPG